MKKHYYNELAKGQWRWVKKISVYNIKKHEYIKKDYPKR